MAEVYTTRFTVCIKREWSESYSYNDELRTRDRDEVMLFMDIPENQINGMICDVLCRSIYSGIEVEEG